MPVHGNIIPQFLIDPVLDLGRHASGHLGIGILVSIMGNLQGFPFLPPGSPGSCRNGIPASDTIPGSHLGPFQSIDFPFAEDHAQSAGRSWTQDGFWFFFRQAAQIAAAEQDPFHLMLPGHKFHPGTLFPFSRSNGLSLLGSRRFLYRQRPGILLMFWILTAAQGQGNCQEKDQTDRLPTRHTGFSRSQEAAESRAFWPSPAALLICQG